jgi:hypothetical protein
MLQMTLQCPSSSTKTVDPNEPLIVNVQQTGFYKYKSTMKAA